MPPGGIKGLLVAVKTAQPKTRATPYVRPAKPNDLATDGPAKTEMAKVSPGHPAIVGTFYNTVLQVLAQAQTRT